MIFRITDAENGQTIREFLRAMRLSTRMLKYLKYRDDGILVDGTRVTVRHVLRTGEVLTLAMTDAESSEAVAPVDLPLQILYEDGDLVVPAKPAGMPTHPSHDHYGDTAANALAFRYREMGVPFVFRPINRLDRNTSGVFLAARNKLAAGRLTRAMSEGKIRKVYLAVLDGEIDGENGVIDACLHRTADSIIVRETCPPDAPDADPARTEYRVLRRENGHTLVEARPITGRTHQLRVHFASIGHPITGDDLYGTPSDLIARHALHAKSLTFPHPATGAEMTVTAPLPEDFCALLTAVFPSLSQDTLFDERNCL